MFGIPFVIIKTLMNITRIINKCRISLKTSGPDDSNSYIFMYNIYEVFLFLNLDISVIKKGNSYF